MIQAADGKLGEMTVGMGAVATTLFAGHKAIKKTVDRAFVIWFGSTEIFLEPNLFIQPMKLKNTLPRIHSGQLITRLGLEYYV